MKDAKQRKAAKDFAAFWKDKGYEKGESQLFWTSLLRNVFGIDEPENQGVQIPKYKSRCHRL